MHASHIACIVYTLLLLTWNMHGFLWFLFTWKDFEPDLMIWCEMTSVQVNPIRVIHLTDFKKKKIHFTPFLFYLGWGELQRTNNNSYITNLIWLLCKEDDFIWILFTNEKYILSLLNFVFSAFYYYIFYIFIL